MNVNELISELRTNILRDTSTAVSLDEADLLWTDTSLLAYINDAYTRFCHLTEYIQDASTEEVCFIEIQEGVTEYPLHPSIIRIMTAQLDNLVLPVVAADVYLGDQSDIVSFERVRQSPYPGVYGVVPDYEIGMAVIVGKPRTEDVGKRIRLRVTRYPIELLTLEQPEASPEIPARFHLDLLEWAAFRALRNHDADGESMAKASAHSTRFERAVDEVKNEYRARKFARIEFSPSWRWN